MGTYLPREVEQVDEEWKATSEDWKQFLRSNVWKDLQFFIQDSIEEAKELLAVSKEERTRPESDDALRGGIKVLRGVLDFPEMQMRDMESLKENEESGEIEGTEL